MHTTNAEIQVGLIGFGLAGRVFHAPVISAVPGLHLSAILQRTGDTAAQSYPDARIVRSLDDLLAIQQLRLIVIATPNTTHYDLARRCLEAGRAVVIDKPFTPTSKEADDLVRLSEKTGRLLSVFHNRRWDGDFRTIQQLLQDGKLGRVVLFESHFDRYRPELKTRAWREQPAPGSGVLYDLGPHLIDQAIVLFGLPEAITADVRTERDGASVDDAFDVVLHYPRLRAVLRATMLAPEPGPRFMLHGTRGSYMQYELDPQEERLARGEQPTGQNWGTRPREQWGTMSLIEGETLTRTKVATAPGDYRGYYENVRDALLSRAPLAVTARQAADVIRVLELAHESSRQRRTLPFTASSAGCGN